MRAAVLSLRERGPLEIIVAVPVGAPASCVQLARVADRLVCLAEPEPFYGVGLWYRVFDQTSDEEVRQLLAQASVEEKTRADTQPPDQPSSS
jgi:putative phosphoribosyl transferase